MNRSHLLARCGCHNVTNNETNNAEYKRWSYFLQIVTQGCRCLKKCTMILMCFQNTWWTARPWTFGTLCPNNPCRGVSNCPGIKRHGTFNGENTMHLINPHPQSAPKLWQILLYPPQVVFSSGFWPLSFGKFDKVSPPPKSEWPFWGASG